MSGDCVDRVMAGNNVGLKRAAACNKLCAYIGDSVGSIDPAIGFTVSGTTVGGGNVVIGTGLVGGLVVVIVVVVVVVVVVVGVVVGVVTVVTYSVVKT